MDSKHTEYTFRFYGRESGAIGVTSEHTVTVSAEDPERAFLRLYETHEHIFGAKLIRTSNDTESAS